MLQPNPSQTLELAFYGTTAGTLGLITLLVARHVGGKAAAIWSGAALAWCAFTWALAASGTLSIFELPPRLFLVFFPALLFTLFLARSRVGDGLLRASWTWLIGLQAFRVAVELAIHHAVDVGVAPPQMTWSGWNLDILTGVTALPVALLATRGVVGRRGVVAWNVAGLLLLGTVVVVGILSMPTPFQQMSPDNTWIAYEPYVWLPAVLVMTAVFLHALSLRKALAL
jgi:hypothetical protein